MADYHGRKHALLTNSGTSALHSMYVAIDLERGDEIICPTYTFYATVTPMLFTGAIPVLTEAREDGNINPEDIERKITDRTKAIVVTHMWGIPCEMDRIMEIAESNNLILLEDSSHSFGASYRGKKTGSFGHAAAMSLQGQKTLTGGEGGVLLTDDDEIFYRALLLGHYNKRCRNEIAENHPLYRYAVTGMGLKFRIHPLAAAIVEQQMEGIGEKIEARRRIAKRMFEWFGNIRGITPPVIHVNVDPSWYAFIMQYDQNELNGLPINDFYEAAVAEGCTELDRPGSTCPLNYHPLFQGPSEIFPEYADTFAYRRGDFPVAEMFHENSLKLPVWHDEEGERLAELYARAFEKVINILG